MIKTLLQNFNKRKVLFEKKSNQNLFGMKFCDYNSHLETMLLVEFDPTVSTKMTLEMNEEEKWIEILEPITINIVDSYDKTQSANFIKWLRKFEQGKNTKGVDMFFFYLNSKYYKHFLSLRGCQLNSITSIDGKPSIIINFFAFSFER